MRDDYERKLTEIVEACLRGGEHAAPDLELTVFAILQMIVAIADWYAPAGPLTIAEIAEIAAFYADLAEKMVAPTRSPAERRVSGAADVSPATPPIF